MVILYAAIREKKLKLFAKLLRNLLVRDWKECFKNQFKTGFRQLITWHLTKFLDWQLLVDRLENGAKFFNFVVVVLCKITPWLAKKEKNTQPSTCDFAVPDKNRFCIKKVLQWGPKYPTSDIQIPESFKHHRFWRSVFMSPPAISTVFPSHRIL